MLALFSVVTMCIAPSCGTADDVVRVLGHEMGEVDDVAKRVPKGGLPGTITPTREAVQAEIDAMMVVLNGDDYPSAKQAANAACIASDASEINSMDSAVDFAIQQTNTPYGRRESVKGLAIKISQAKTSDDRAKVIAQAAICQWAGS